MKVLYQRMWKIRRTLEFSVDLTSMPSRTATPSDFEDIVVKAVRALSARLQVLHGDAATT